MGVKALRNHYNIRHTVHVVEGFILIGSGYISDLIKITPGGKIVKKNSVISSGSTLDCLIHDIESDPDLFAELFAQQDEFEQSITVYTYQDDKIIEKQCEHLGWPNTTHDGVIMYDNTFSTNKDVIIEKAKENILYALNGYRHRKKKIMNDLATLDANLTRYEALKTSLDKQYPLHQLIHAQT